MTPYDVIGEYKVWDVSQATADGYARLLQSFRLPFVDPNGAGKAFCLAWDEVGGWVVVGWEESPWRRRRRRQ